MTLPYCLFIVKVILEVILVLISAIDKFVFDIKTAHDAFTFGYMLSHSQP